MLVPLIVAYKRGRGAAEITATPGAATSTCPPRLFTPPHENGAMPSLDETAPTPTIEGQLAGCPTGAITPGLELQGYWPTTGRLPTSFAPSTPGDS